jgi:hypothetical protein
MRRSQCRIHPSNTITAMRTFQTAILAVVVALVATVQVVATPVPCGGSKRGA